ncbi:prepilin-type N-terminal cleavage/methylation domain-containing protein [Colwellia demingiae]|uniref:Type II secretion system protein H n=1 Tax=Colwellia demingiae TaxID=89401 RepID=A0A5C6QML5_9GAMM|nr:GspH/FimT family pseudopilin [Colwellia demingiae]TWX69752.1 prepilin-type N-terminal cleavage/methylation domain-containing protein [Colwellia demingiae]
MQPSLLNINNSNSTGLSRPKIRKPPQTTTIITAPKKELGFTLIELMITIAVAAIIMAVAVPSLSSFTAKIRVDNEISELQRLLLTTRNAAINSGQNATLCPLQADDTCQNTINWTGRIGIVSIDGLIKEREAIQGGDKLDFIFNSVIYNPSGQLSNNNIGTFSYCPKGFSDFSRGIDLSLAGRAYLSSDMNGDGKDQDRNNNNIVCI